MGAQQLDSEASAMEMNPNNISLYLLAGKQALRIDMLESALTSSEKTVDTLMAANQDQHERIHALEAQADEMGHRLEIAKKRAQTRKARMA